METCGFFDANLQSDGITYDRVYSASNFADYFKLLIGNGVFASPTNQLKVSAGSGLQIVISAGWAFIDGYWYHNDANKAITAAFAGKTSKVVIRLDRTNRTVTAQVVTNSSTPTRTSSIYEIVLATVTAASGVTQISTSMITDKRGDSSVCGFVTGLVDVVDTGDLFAQYQAIFDDWFDHMKGQLTTDAAGNLQTEVDNLSSNLYTNGSKNFFPPCTDWMDFPEKTYSNVTLKCSDDSFTLSGTSNAPGTLGFNFFHELYGFDSLMKLFRNLIGKEIVLSIGNAFNNGNTRMLIIFVNSSYTEISRIELKGTNTYVTGIVPSGTVGVECQIYIPNGTAAFNPSVVYKPMLCLKSDWDMDNTYEPPTMTNRRLTTDKVGMDLLSEVGAVNYFNNTMASDTQGETAFTVNSDKSVTVVVSSTTPTPRNINAPITLKAGTYLFRGCPKGAPATIKMTCYSLTDSRNLATDTGDGVIFTINKTHECNIYIDFRTNAPAGTYKFEPMVAPPNYNGPYVPYAMTNRELTEDVADIPYVALTDNGSSEYTLSEGAMWQTKGVTFLYVAVQCNTVSPSSGGNHIKISEIPSKFKKPPLILYPAIAPYRDATTGAGTQLQIATNGQLAIRGGEAGGKYCGLFSY